VTQEKIVRYWVETAEDNYASMKRIFSAGEYVWALFIGHLVIEKLLKACCARTLGKEVPKIHDLLRLAEKAGLETTPERRRILDRLTAFQVNVRYPHQRYDLYKKATKEYTQRYIEEVAELREWLLGILSE